MQSFNCLLEVRPVLVIGVNHAAALGFSAAEVTEQYVCTSLCLQVCLDVCVGAHVCVCVASAS